MGLRCCILVLLLFPLLSQGKVTSFGNCKTFFLNDFHPTVLIDPKNNNRYREICQCLNVQNDPPQYYYATLYDTNNKIPVYSAYKLQHADVERKNPWYIEPQLDGGSNICMGPQNPNLPIHWGQHQALNTDYSSSGYQKGHLYPVYHTSTYSSMLATSTLTNAAPQVSNFNQGPWRVQENKLFDLLKNKVCLEVYVVTGVVPGNTHIGNGVRVAEYYWSAHCCVKKLSKHSEGYFGPNNNGKLDTLSLQELEIKLSNDYDSQFSVFPGGC